MRDCSAARMAPGARTSLNPGMVVCAEVVRLFRKVKPAAFFLSARFECVLYSARWHLPLDQLGPVNSPGASPRAVHVAGTTRDCQRSRCGSRTSAPTPGEDDR